MQPTDCYLNILSLADVKFCTDENNWWKVIYIVQLERITKFAGSQWGFTAGGT